MLIKEHSVMDVLFLYPKLVGRLDLKQSIRGGWLHA